MNALYYGDNLTVLRRYIPDESVDLIYLDPPFNSNRNYNVLFKDESNRDSVAQLAAFKDTWHWDRTAQATYAELVTDVSNVKVSAVIETLRQVLGASQMMAYLVMMTARLIALHRVLKRTGSLYLHCDPTASHYLRIVLDAIFGAENFRNEIIWKRTSAHNAARRWGDVHDVIFFYTKSDQFAWNKVTQGYDPHYVQSEYRHEDARGRYCLSDLTGAGKTQGDSAVVWRGYDPSAVGRHWSVPKDLIAAIIAPEQAEQLSTAQKLDLLAEHGYLHFPSKSRRRDRAGFPRYKRYLSDGIPIQSVITDIPPLNAHARERLGYPTQKPIALLERIIQASSQPNDVVLDPFCGCGTAVVAAQKLGRQWIGIDITHLAISLIKSRLSEMFPELGDIKTIGEPVDLAGARDLAQADRYQFQWWALSLVKARPVQGKRGADQGIDGVINFFDDNSGRSKRILVQVESGEVSAATVRELRGALEREGAQMALLITLEPPTAAMYREAAAAGEYQHAFADERYPRLQILTIEALIERGARPHMPPPFGTFKQAARETPRLADQAPLI
jgi:DNA modification methylase